MDERWKHLLEGLPVLKHVHNYVFIVALSGGDAFLDSSPLKTQITNIHLYNKPQTHTILYIPPMIGLHPLPVLKQLIKSKDTVQ